MPVGPPQRSLFSELVIAGLIYVGAIAASMLAALCLSAIPMAFIQSGDEGALLVQPVISNFIALLITPALFAAFAANHCRRVPAYLVPLTPILWVMQFALWQHQHFISKGESLALGGSSLTGLALGYWVLRRKAHSFEPATKVEAVEH